MLTIFLGIAGCHPATRILRETYVRPPAISSLHVNLCPLFQFILFFGENQTEFALISTITVMAFCLKLLQPQPHSTRLTLTRLPWRLKSLLCAPVLLLQDKMCLLDARLVLKRRLYVYHLKMVVVLMLYTGLRC